MKESSQFNVFHQFAGCFVPHGLLSIKNLSAGAKICYAVLAQQANARGTTQLNLPLVASSIGESERVAVHLLIELEESGLIESARGNVNKEDVSILFPRHPWLSRNAGLAQASGANSVAHAAEEIQPQLFAVELGEPSAQRLSASLESSHRRSPPQRIALSVLNAFRHHWNLHLTINRTPAPYKKCSTPFGIIGIFTRRLAFHVEIAGTCSTPFGIIGIFTREPTRPASSLFECSTPFGIIGIFTDGRACIIADSVVLNAFRHHWNLHKDCSGCSEE